jgi:TonB-linked SusC/RagA family outer membrane protein
MKKKWMIAMRIAYFSLLVFLVLPAMAGVTQTRVTARFSNETLEEVLQEIKKQTGVFFMYNTLHVDGKAKVTAELEDVVLEEALEIVLRGLPYTYLKEHEHILVLPRASVQAREASPVIVTGMVKDERGEALPGVTVRVKGTSTGGVTDRQGNFRIVIPRGGATLVFSFVGMESVEVKVEGEAPEPLTVRMKEQLQQLGDVVVTGYFSRMEETFTGSVRSVKGEDLLKVNSNNLLAALSVIEPAFRLIENNTQGSNPNFVPEFEVRGSSSLPVSSLTRGYSGNPNMPTFILDGFPVSAEKVFDLDPQRVDNVTLLKDAAATAMYGSRAANGVVIITTKVPVGGRIDISYNLDIGGTFPDLRDYHVLNAEQKVELERIVGLYDYEGKALADEGWAGAYNERLKLLARGNDTYWLNKPLRDAFAYKHTLSLEGGEGNLRFMLDATYDKSAGVMKVSDRTRKGLGLAVQYTVRDKLVLKNHMTYDDVLGKDSPYGSFSTYVLMNPYYALYNEDGSYTYMLEDDYYYGSFSDVYNPLFNTTLHSIDESRYNEWRNNFSADWLVNDDLRLRGDLSLYWADGRADVFYSGMHTMFIYMSQERRGNYVISGMRDRGYDMNLVASYNRRVGNHFINGNVVFNLSEQSSDDFTAYMEGFPDDKLDFINFGMQYMQDMIVDASDETSRMLGVVGSANYSYDDRYLMDISFRADASSKFGAERRWAPFSALGLGWNLHHEKFLREARLVNRLKARVSYGLTGSQAYNPYQSLVTYEYDPTQRYHFGVGATMMGPGNKELEWQKTIKTNAGLDVELWNSRISCSFDYYHELSEGLLSDINLPPSLGFPSYRANLGEIVNQGVEASVRVSLVKKKDAWVNVMLNGICNRNTVKKLSENVLAWNELQDELYLFRDITRPRVRFMEGVSTKAIWGLESLGINPASGKEIFRTPDGRITDEWKSEYQQPIGVNEPDLEGNLGLNAGYKGFQLTAYFRYRVGGQVYNQTLVDKVENANPKDNVDQRKFDESWKQEGDVTYFRNIAYGYATEATSRFVNEYNYLQWSSLNASYDFDPEWLRPVGMKSMRLSFSMNDIFRRSTVKEERGINYPFARSAKISLRIVY